MDYWNGLKGPYTLACARGMGRKGVLLMMCGKIESMEGSCVRISPGVDSACLETGLYTRQLQK